MSHLVTETNLPKKEYPTFKSLKDYWAKEEWHCDSELSRYTLVGRRNGIGILEEYPGGIFPSEEAARNAIMKQAREKGIACQYYGSSDILETNPQDKKCLAFIEKINGIQLKIRTLVENEFVRVSKQKYLTCPECGSKISSEHKVPKSFSDHHLDSSLDIPMRRKFSLATDSYYSYEKVPHKLRALVCPVCQRGHMEGATFQQKLEALKKKLSDELEKFYTYRISQGKVVFWKIYGDFYEG